MLPHFYIVLYKLHTTGVPVMITVFFAGMSFHATVLVVFFLPIVPSLSRVYTFLVGFQFMSVNTFGETSIFLVRQIPDIFLLGPIFLKAW